MKAYRRSILYLGLHKKTCTTLRKDMQYICIFMALLMCNFHKNKKYKFKVNNSIRLDVCMYLWSHYHNSGNEHMHHLKSFPMSLCNPSFNPLPPTSQATLWSWISLHILYFRRMESQVLFCLAFLSTVILIFFHILFWDSSIESRQIVKNLFLFVAV